MEGIAKHGPCIVWVSSTRIMNYHLTPAATPLKTSPSLNFHSGFVMHTSWTEEGLRAVRLGQLHCLKKDLALPILLISIISILGSTEPLYNKRSLPPAFNPLLSM